MPFLAGLRKALVSRPVVSSRPGKGREPLDRHLIALGESLDRCGVSDLESKPLQAELRDYSGTSLIYLDSESLEEESPIAVLRRWAKERLHRLDAPLEMRIDVSEDQLFMPSMESASTCLVTLFEEFLSVSGFCRGLQGIVVEAHPHETGIRAALEILGSCVPCKMLALEERGFGIVLENALCYEGLTARAFGRNGMARIELDLAGSWA